MIAKTLPGLEEVLAQELTELGANDVEIGRRMVAFSGDKEMMYRANFCLRTALRVLKTIDSFYAETPDEVYEKVQRVHWEEYLDPAMTFAVDTVVYSEEFRHSKFVAYRVKDAIADYFREREGKRPNIGLTQPDLRVHLHIADKQCTLALDSSGESLHLRGYRVASCAAPINEVLAAGLLKLTGWKADCDLIDPFCGSGTIAIEAALMARNIYPGIFRKEYGFERWKDFDRDLLDSIYNDDSEERTFDHRIYAYDINRPTLAGAEANAKSAGVTDIITFAQKDFREFEQPEMPAVIVTNPPYGTRLTPPDLLELYQDIGKCLKHAFKGGDAWIISAKEECFDAIGLRPSVKYQLFNGALDCEFRKYQMFDGKMEDFRMAGGDIKNSEDRRHMQEKHRSRTERTTFSRHRESDEEMTQDEQYQILERKHAEFERNRVFQERAEEKRRRREEGREEFFPRQEKSFSRREKDFPRRENKFGSREGGFKKREGGFGSQGKRFGDRDRRFGDRDKRFGDRDKRFGGGNDRFGGRDNRFGGGRGNGGRQQGGFGQRRGGRGDR